MKLERKNGERGANLVEFALLAPMLILLVLGIVEFSWLLARNLDVNQGAREGARMVAVDVPAGNSALKTEICTRMSLVGSNPATTVSWSGVDSDTSGTYDVGEAAIVTVSSPTTPTLTGLIDFFFAGFSTMDSTVEIRIEQPPTWTDLAATACP